MTFDQQTVSFFTKMVHGAARDFLLGALNKGKNGDVMAGYAAVPQGHAFAVCIQTEDGKTRRFQMMEQVVEGGRVRWQIEESRPEITQQITTSATLLSQEGEDPVVTSLARETEIDGIGITVPVRNSIETAKGLKMKAAVVQRVVGAYML